VDFRAPTAGEVLYIKIRPPQDSDAVDDWRNKDFQDHFVWPDSDDDTGFFHIAVGGYQDIHGNLGEFDELELPKQVKANFEVEITYHPTAEQVLGVCHRCVF
jgi:hypothetical protein